MAQSVQRVAPVDQARETGKGFADSRTFEWLARAGLVARGVIYAVVGILAIKLALGDGGKTTDQNGALQTIATQPFGKGAPHHRHDRTGRLRDLAAPARRDRSRPGVER